MLMIFFDNGVLEFDLEGLFLDMAQRYEKLMWLCSTTVVKTANTCNVFCILP